MMDRGQVPANTTCPQCQGSGQIPNDFFWLRLSDGRFVFVKAPSVVTAAEKSRILEWIQLQLCVEELP